MPYESHSEMADRLADALARLQRARDENMELRREIERLRTANERMSADLAGELEDEDGLA